MRTVATHRNRKGSAAVGACVAFVLAGLTLGPAVADDIYWNEPTGGSFDAAMNWSPQQVPGANDTAIFNLGQSPAYVVTLPGGATVDNMRCIVHTDEVALDLNGAAYWLADNFGLVVGESAGDWGLLRMTGGELHAQNIATGQGMDSYGSLELGAGMSVYVANDLALGDVGTGDFVMTEGAQVLTNGMRLGYDAWGYGYAGLYGDGTHLDVNDVLACGIYGHGGLDIWQGASVNTNWLFAGWTDGSGGDAWVMDPGSQLTVGEGMYIGDSGGGYLSVGHAGTVHASWLDVGSAPYARGEVYVAEDGSSLTTAGNIIIGREGQGELHVGYGAEVRSLEPSGWILIARDPGSIGHVELYGGTLRAEHAPLVVGDQGQATLEMYMGAEVYSDGELFAGVQPTGAATVLIQGDGTRYESNSVYPTVLGDYGSAAVTINDGAWMAVRSACIMAKRGGATGTLTLSGAGSTLEAPVLLVGREGTATLTINDGRVGLGVDPATVPAGELHLGLNAELGGTGTIVGDIVNRQGTAWPGGSIGWDIWTGILSVNGEYEQQPDGGFFIELGGPTLGDEYCALHVTGTATLDGELFVLPVNDFVPQPGQEFEILTADAVVGEFAWVHGDGGPYCTVYEPTRVTIALAEVGDCTYDCRVDADDLEFVLSCWSGPDELISEHCRCGDADDDWDVDLADFAVVQTRASGA